MSADGEMKWAVQFVLCQNAIDILQVSGSKKKLFEFSLCRKQKYISAKKSGEMAFHLNLKIWMSNFLVWLHILFHLTNQATWRWSFHP